MDFSSLPQYRSSPDHDKSQQERLVEGDRARAELQTILVLWLILGLLGLLLLTYFAFTLLRVFSFVNFNVGLLS